MTLLLQPERGLAAAFEELRNRRPELLLEVAVQIDERTAETSGHFWAECRLACAHEADEGEVTVSACVRAIDSLQVRVVGGEDVRECVAAELLPRRARELPRNTCLGDDGKCLDRGCVAALDERLSGFARREVDRPEGRISVGSGFIAARTTISSPLEIPPSIPPA